jgi:hypothetical protein
MAKTRLQTPERGLLNALKNLALKNLSKPLSPLLPQSLPRYV